jgi:aminopeptidase N
MLKDEGLSILLDLKGIVSYFESHKPSAEELWNCQRVVLMSDHPWDPHDPAFEEQEWAAQYHFGESKVCLNGDRFIESIEQVSGEHFKVIPAPPEFYYEDTFIESIEQVSGEHFKVILVPLELYNEDVIMKRFVAAVNIASDDTVGNGMSGYGDKELFGVSEEA